MEKRYLKWILITAAVCIIGLALTGAAGTHEDTDLERIRKMDIVSIEKKSRIYDRMTFCIKIDWTIAGMDGVENITCEYLAGVDVSNGDYRLISFEIRGE